MPISKKTNTSPDLSREYIGLRKKYSRDTLVLRKEIAQKDKKIFSKANMALDKYYTKAEVAQQCIQDFSKAIKNLGLPSGVWIEPSAGAGAFLNLMPPQSIGLDIAPSQENILEHDFLTEDFLTKIKTQCTVLLTNHPTFLFIGNPPFGVKGKLALDFLNHALSLSPLVGFIVPLQFRKWSIQSKITAGAYLYEDKDLPEAAFELMGKDYKLRCSFQIWVNPVLLSSEQTTLPNLRITHRPQTSHPDFVMYQYNCTTEAQKYFDYDWDFALPRQGYANYQLRVKDKTQTNLRQQWIFFKAKNKKILKRLLNLNYEALSRKNSGVPGFGKADVVAEYLKHYPQK